MFKVRPLRIRRVVRFADLRDFQTAHRQWVEQGLENGLLMRDDRWSESIAVGRLAFVERVKNDLAIKAMHREVLKTDGTYALREPSEAYTRNFTAKNEALTSENTLAWNESPTRSEQIGIARTSRSNTRIFIKQKGD